MRGAAAAFGGDETEDGLIRGETGDDGDGSEENNLQDRALPTPRSAPFLANAKRVREARPAPQALYPQLIALGHERLLGRHCVVLGPGDTLVVGSGVRFVRSLGSILSPAAVITKYPGAV